MVLTLFSFFFLFFFFLNLSLDRIPFVEPDNERQRKNEEERSRGEQFPAKLLRSLGRIEGRNPITTSIADVRSSVADNASPETLIFSLASIIFRRHSSAGGRRERAKCSRSSRGIRANSFRLLAAPDNRLFFLPVN